MGSHALLSASDDMRRVEGPGFVQVARLGVDSEEILERGEVAEIGQRNNLFWRYRRLGLALRDNLCVRKPRRNSAEARLEYCQLRIVWERRGDQLVSGVCKRGPVASGWLNT